MNLHRYVRSRLHRRLFVWFGATILFSTVVVSLAMFLLSGWYNEGWSKEMERAQRFASGRFAHVWDAPAEREELARAIAEELEIPVKLSDASGAAIGTFGTPATGPDCGGRTYAFDVSRGGDRLGVVELCFDRRKHGPGRVIIPLVLVGLVLWGASRKIAKRLARPLAEVAHVAHEIGAGKLHARANLECRMPDEIGAIAHSINDMAERIERQLRDQRVLLAAVSHELRTPLGHVRILLELMRGDGRCDPKTIDELEREVLEIDTLVGELLASSRLDFTAITRKELDAVDLARRALDRAGLPAELLRIEGGPAIAFEGDATLIARALANLIDNARKHGGGAQALVVRARGKGAAFEVEDAGSGFPDGENGEVFEPFYRGRNGERSDNGTLGLGLSLVKRIAEAHGGRAYATNRAGGGARVGFEVG